MAVKYTLDFQTNTGSDITYELDILDSSFSGVATRLKGQASPITIEWKRDRDVYSPIMGSRASINLLLEDGDVVDDFNDAAPFTYEVRLRYKDSDDNLHDVWRGWIDPNDGEERIGSYPIPVSYVATDGIVNLDSPIRSPEDRGDVLLLHYILFALEKTGLGLDVLIDSSIQDSNGNDPLTSVSVNELAFISESTEVVYPQNADSRREVLGGILAAFNCSVRQANGKWYIFNNSLHGGTGDNESNTWKAYEYNTASANKVDGTNYEAVNDVTENLVYTLDSSSSTDLYVKDESMFLTPRYPYGSVECRFQDLRPLQLVVNPRFDDGVNGWQANPSSLDSTLTRSVTGGVNGASLTTNRSRENSDGYGEIWFETDTTKSLELSKNFPHELKFHWRYEVNSGGGTRKVRLKYQIFAQFESNISRTFIKQLNLFNPIAWITGNVIETEEVTTNELIYNAERDRWSVNPEGNSYWDGGDIIAESDAPGAWVEETVSLAKIGEFVRNLGDFDASIPDEIPKLGIRVFYPEARDGDGDRQGASTSRINTYIDNFSCVPVYSGDDANPIFERAQDNYTTTMSYEPRVIGSDILEQQFFEIMDTLEYWEHDQNPSTDLSRGLEEIVTNQKLKDFQDQFYYYEIDFINNNVVPIAQHNKVELGLTDHNSDTTLILDGGTFDPKMNTYRLGAYIPNQTGGVDFGTFYEHNVELVGADAPDRTREKTIVVSYNFQSVDDDDNEVADGLTAPEKWITATGLPGQIIPQKVILHPGDAYEIDGLPELLDTDENPAPNSISGISFDRVGSFVEVTFNLIIPEEDEYEEAYFKATVDELVGDNSRVIISATNSASNVTISEGTDAITEIGPVGSTERFVYHVVPGATYEISPANLTVTLNSVKDGNDDSDTDVSGVVNSAEIQKVQAGNGVLVIIPFTYSETSPVYVKLTFTGSATAISSASSTSIEIRATETGSETDDWQIDSNGDVPNGASYDAVFTASGVPGSPFSAIFEISPESGRYVDANSVTLGSLDESWLGDYYVVSSQQASSEALVFLTGTFPTTDANGDDSATITVDCNVLDPASTSAVAHTYSWSNGTGYFFNNTANTYSASLEEGEVATFVISLEAGSGNKLGTITPSSTEGGAPSISYDVDIVETGENGLPTGVTVEAKTPYHTNGVIEVVEYTMKVVGQATSQSETINFSGTVGTQDDIYTLRINLNSTDAFNAKISTSFIDVPFGDADLGDTDSTDRTFTIESADSQMEYTAVGDVSITSSDTSIIANGNITKSISSNVITATIGSLTIPSSIPTTGLVEVDVTVAGPAPNFKPATKAEIFWGQEVSSSQVFMERDDTYFKFRVVTDGAWDLDVDFSSDGINYSNYAGTTGTQDSATSLGYGFVQTFRNNTGADRYYRCRIYPEGDTSNVLDTMIVVQRGDYTTRSLDVSAIRVLTQAEYDNLGDAVDTDNVLYLIEQ